MKTTNSFTSNLDAVRAAAKAHSTQLASAAAISPAPAPVVLAPAQEPAKSAAKESAVEPQPAKLQQFNVRLSATAKNRLQASARAAHLSDQEFLELLALSLPEPQPIPAPKLPWQQ